MSSRRVVRLLLAAAAIAVTSTACAGGAGPTDPAAGATASACSPDAQWARNVDGRDAADDVLEPDVTGGIGATADDAVRALADELGTTITVRERRRVDATTALGDDLEIDVVDAQGEAGTYRLADKSGVWVVTGGQGCGAPAPPRRPDDEAVESTCIPPSDLATVDPVETLHAYC